MNLFINLFNYEVFIKCYEGNIFEVAFKNLSLNGTEIYIFSFNIALFFASFIGIIFIGDILSLILFSIYLSAIVILIIWKMFRIIKTGRC